MSITTPEERLPEARPNAPVLHRSWQALLGDRREGPSLDALLSASGIPVESLDRDLQQVLQEHWEEIDQHEKRRVQQFTLRHRLHGLDTYLYVEQNSHGGSILLDLSEQLPEEEFQTILAALESVNFSTAEFRRCMDEDNRDSEFWHKVVSSIDQRVCELVALIDQVAREGVAETVVYDRYPLRIDRQETVLKVLRALCESLQWITTQVNASWWQPAEQQHGTTVYWGGPERGRGGLMVQLREYPTPNDQKTSWEYDGEARINFLINIETDQRFSPDVHNARRDQAFSIRIDREGLVFDEHGQLIQRDPLLPQGKVSVDIGSFFAPAGSANRLIAECLALGNAAFARRTGRTPTYYHNREHFTPEDGTIDRFAWHTSRRSNRALSARPSAAHRVMPTGPVDTPSELLPLYSHRPVPGQRAGASPGQSAATE